MIVKFISKYWPLFWFGAAAILIKNTLYVRKKYKSVVSTDKFTILITHEKVHFEQQKCGWLKWTFKYIFSSKFRYSQELEAYKSEIKMAITLNKKYKNSIYLDGIAKAMSSRVYFWMCTYEQAKKDLVKGQ